MVVLASGSRVSIAFARCTDDDPGVLPTGFTTAQNNMAALAPYSTIYSQFQNTAVNFVTTYGYEQGMFFRSTGFTAANNNGYWRITGFATDTTANDTIRCYAIPDPSAQLTTVEAAGGTKYVQLSMYTLRATGRNLNLEKNILESAEIDPNRYKKDVRHGFNRVVGAVGFQLSCSDFMDMIRSCIGGNKWYSYACDTTGNLDFTPGGDGTCTVVKLTAPYDWAQDGVRPGDTVAFESCANTQNNGQNLVLSVSTNTLVVYDPENIKVNNDADATATVKLAGLRMDQETLLQTFIMERSFADIAQHQAFDGCIVDSMSISVSPEAIVGGTMNILGMSSRDWSATSIVSAATTGKANTSENPPLAAFEGLILEGGSIIAVITGLEVTIANSRSLPAVVGSKFAPTLTDGICVPTGTVTCYFEDATMVEKFVDETDSSLWLKLYEPGATTRNLTMVMPKIKYTGGAIDPPAEGPVTLEMPFMALGVADQPMRIIGGSTVYTHSHCISFQDSTLFT